MNGIWLMPLCGGAFASAGVVLVLIEREPLAQLRHFRTDLLRMVRIVLFCHEAHPPGDLRHLRLPEAPGSDGGSAYPDTAGDEGLLRVVGDGVLVHRDAYLIQPVLILLAGEAKVPGVHQNQMVVRAAGDKPEAPALAATCRP